MQISQDMKAKSKTNQPGSSKNVSLAGLLLLVSALAVIVFGKQLVLPQKATVYPVRLDTILSSTPDKITVSNLIAAVNKQRTDGGQSTLEEDKNLDLAASYIADDIVTNKYWGTTNPTTGKTWIDFIAEAHYPKNWAGIDLAKGFPSTSAVVDNWMKSSSDKENILSSHFTQIGEAVEEDPNNNFMIVVQLLAAPQVENGNAGTNTTYQNYGWYMHNGQSMQYINGNWYTTAQQDVTPTSQQNSNSNGSSYTIEPTVTCVLSYGTYQLTQTECDSAKQQDTTYVHCQTSTGNYLLTPQECATALQNDSQNTNTSTIQQNNNGNLYNQCVSTVQYNYNQNIQSCNQYGGTSAYDACMTIYQQQEQQAISNCGAEYPH